MLWSETVKEVKVFPSDSRALLTLSSDISRTLTSWDIVQSTIEFGIKTRKTLSPTFKARLKGKVKLSEPPNRKLVAPHTQAVPHHLSADQKPRRPFHHRAGSQGEEPDGPA